MAEEKETIILEFQVEQGDAIGELEKTKRSIIEIKKEQQELNKAYKAGNVTLDEYASESVRLEGILKKQSNTYNTLQKSATGVETQFDKLIKTNKELVKTNKSIADGVNNAASSLSSVIPGFAQLQGGINTATTASKAFIATPLGAVIGAIGLAVAAVTSYFSKFESVMDLVENTVTKATAVFSSFIQNIDKVGEILGNVFTGNLEAAANGLGLLTEELGNAADESMRLLEMTRELEDAELKFRIESAAGANQMKAYVVAAKNKSLSIEESNALLQKASDLEKSLTEQAVANAQKRLDIEEGKLVASKKSQLAAADLLKKAGQSQKEYLDSLITSGIFSPEQLEPVIAAYEKVEQKASEGLAFQEKVANQQEALREKERVDIEKSIALREKEYQALLKIQSEEDKLLIQKEANAQKQQEILIKELEGYDERIKAVQEYANQIAASVVIEQEQADVLDETTQKAIDSGRKRVEADTDIGKRKEALKKNELQSAVALSAAIAGLNQADKEAQKAFALATITVSSAAGVAKAIQAGAGIPFPGNLAAIFTGITTVLTGITQARNILSGFAEGGYTGPGGKYEPAGIVHKGEVVFNQRDVALMGGPNRVNAMRPTFKGYADGGIVTAASTAPINQSFAFRSAVNKQPQIVASWKEATELNARIQFKEALVTL